MVGRRVELLNGRTVTVAELVEHDGALLVGWRRGEIFGRAHKLAGQPREVGTFRPCRPGETVAVRRLGAMPDAADALTRSSS